MRARSVALAALLLGACGSGGQTVPPFVQGIVIGPSGGSMEAGPARCDVPAGALAEDVVCAILPQPTPLPIDPAEGPVQYVGGIMCIGPVGRVLLVPGHVRMAYDRSLIPPGRGQGDLVLLEWDDVAGLMRVAYDAVHDTVEDRFDDPAYGALGHVAVGVRMPRPFEFVFLADPAPSGLRANALAIDPGSLALGHTDGTTPAIALAGTAGADLYQPSTDGTRVAFRAPGPSETSLLRSVDADTGDLRTLAGSAETWEDGPDTFGWVPGVDRVYHVLRSSPPAGGFEDDFADVPGDGSAAASPLASPGTDRRIVDLRVSPDGRYTLVRWVDAGNDNVHGLDVVETATGDAVGLDLPLLPLGDSQVTPRWLPDSSGLYYVESGQVSVTRVDPDGSNPTSLYDLSLLGSHIVDFVVSPDEASLGLADGHAAYLRFDRLLVGDLPPGGSSAPQCVLVVDRLDGADPHENGLGLYYGVDEMVWHPDGGTVWAQMRPPPPAAVVALDLVPPNGDGAFVAVFDGASAATVRTINVSLGSVDVERTTGRVLVHVSDQGVDPVLDGPGLWLLGSDGTGQTWLDLPGALAVGPARWMRSWRLAPGAPTDPRVR